MTSRLFIFSIFLLSASSVRAEDNAARAFGARESVRSIMLAPSGHSVAYVAMGPSGGTALFLQNLDLTVPPIALLKVSAPEELTHCEYLEETRVSCSLTGIAPTSEGPRNYNRLIAIDTDGKNMTRLEAGSVIDLHGGAPSAMLIESQSIVRDGEAVGVDRLNSRTGETEVVEHGNPRAIGFMSDGKGTVRLMSVRPMRRGGYDRSQIEFYLRPRVGAPWEPYATYDPANRSGFLPMVVDGAQGKAFGVISKDGRLAAVARSLDGAADQSLVYADPDVDVDDFMTVGSEHQVIGVVVTKDYSQPIYTDPKMASVAAAIGKAIPGYPSPRVIDASADRRVLLIYAGRDDDPGVYYLFDRERRELKTFVVARSALEGMALSKMEPIRYLATDSVEVPGYLTLPPGRTDAKGLPAIVLPHGGPAARDAWGFDWLAQYYAHEGYAVLQPNFRGSTGYGDAWYLKNGFRSWRIAIGDVVDAGRWLVSHAGVDPSRVGIVGWSYGGYAALQAAETAPDVFKAVVAIAPVTDLSALRENSRRWSDYYLVSDYLGTGAELDEASPTRHAKNLRAPVLLVHSKEDGVVPYDQSERMLEAMKRASVQHEMLTFDGLGHSLNDADARAQLLERSVSFLRDHMGHASAPQGNP